MTEASIKIPFDVFYNEHYHQVYWYIYKKINRAEDAEDLAQDVFCACYKHYENYDPEKSSLSTWLFVAVNNRLKNYYRDRKTGVDIESIEEFDSIVFSLGDGGEGEESIIKPLLIDDYRDMLAEAISTLDEKHQMIVVLKFFCDKSSDEIANIVDTSAGNVRQILSRSLKRLGDYFDKHAWNAEV